MNDLTALVTGMIALSMGVERIVEIFKGMAPWIKGRDVWIHLLAALSGAVIALLVGPHAFLAVIPTEGPGSYAGAALLGLMASGGSAFWNNILDIVTAAKTARESVSAKLATSAGGLGAGCSSG